MELAKTSSCIAQYYRMQGIFLAFVQCQKSLLATVRKEYKHQNVIISPDDVENLWTVFQCQFYPVYAFGQIVAGGPVAQRAFNEFVKCQIKWRMSECVMMGHTTTAV